MKLPTPEAAEETRRFIKRAGGDATWDRLAEYLEKELNNRDVFVINRTFTAPLDLVFKMWTDPKCFSRWLPPTGFEMQFIRRNIRAGGSTFYMMTDGRNTTLYGRTQYLEIESPDHLVYTQQFCDKGEEISRHPLTPTWPETMLTTVSLAAEGLERTRVTVKWEPYGPATQEEIDVFASARAGMTVGWTGSFDKLEALLDED